MITYKALGWFFLLIVDTHAPAIEVGPFPNFNKCDVVRKDTVGETRKHSSFNRRQALYAPPCYEKGIKGGK